VGIAWPERVAPVTRLLPQDWVIASVLLVMSLGLETRTAWNAVRRPIAAALAFAVNLGVVPVLAWLASHALESSLAEGLIVASVVPCTQASAAVWTRRAGGNDTIAVITTMSTGLACFIATPAWLELLVGRTGAAQDFGRLVTRLALLVALPIVLGQLLRAVAPVRTWATQHAKGLARYAQLGILSMVLIGAVECGRQLGALSEGVGPLAGQIVMMVVLAAAVHTAAWGLGYWSASRLGLSRSDQIGVAFAGSQKTLMVGLAIAIDFGGLAVLPMVAYHVEQLLIDTVLVDWLQRGSTTEVTESTENSRNRTANER
jgi:solute carrier family 10 (sodium/bile acid cotransporter), member 7